MGYGGLAMPLVGVELASSALAPAAIALIAKLASVIEL
jgi:hypothetical protein